MTDPGRLLIEITTGHCLGGEGNDVFPGQVLEAPRDLSIADALKKVRIGYARIVPNEPEPSPAPTTISQSDPAIESRDPETEPRGRSRAGRR